MKILINPAYSFLSSFISKLPSGFSEGGEVVYQARNTIKRFIIGNDDILIKSFKEPIFINRIAYTFFRRSKAHRSYKFSFELQRHGILTPDPIAYIEVKSLGLMKNSFFLSKNMTNTSTMRAYSYGDDNTPGLSYSLAKYLLKLHDEGVYHVDLSPGNILYERDENGNFSFYLVDINRMSFNKQFNMKSRAHNLNRLTENYDVTTSLAREYSHLAGFPEKEFIDLVNNYADHFYYSRTIKSVSRTYRSKHNLITSMFYGPVTRHLMLRFASMLVGQNSTIGKKIFEKRKELYNRYFKREDYRGGMARIFGY